MVGCPILVGVCLATGMSRGSAAPAEAVRRPGTVDQGCCALTIQELVTQQGMHLCNVPPLALVEVWLKKGWVGSWG